MPKKTLSGRYYVPAGVCEDCAKNRRMSRPNSSVQLLDDLVVTANIRKRLKNKAELEIPKTIVDKLPQYLFAVIFITSFILGLVYLSSDFPKPPGVFGWVVAFAWLGLTIGSVPAVDLLFSGPIEKRNNAVKSLTIELAQERAETYEDRERFYGSPEWRKLRETVIKEDGPICGDCRRRIKKEVDITVDHIRPRSKYPHLALDRNNLRVLCRSCNSSKGTRLKT